MKITELRFGNYVYDLKGFPYKIDDMEFKGNGYGRVGLYLNYRVDKDEITPIPLTEEWLLKFGFEKTFEYAYNVYRFKGKFVIKGGDNFYWEAVKLDYVHQLQNLYFALTRNELEIKKNI